MDTAHQSRDVILGLAVAGSRAGLAAARAALLPARILARTPAMDGALNRVAAQGKRTRDEARRLAEATAQDVLASPELGRMVDQALAGRLTDSIAGSLAEHRVIERIAAQMAASGELERALTAALEHEITQQLVDEILASPGFERLLVQVIDSRVLLEITDRVLLSAEMQRMLDHLVSSPEVRRALAEQTQGMAEEMAAGVRRRTGTIDDLAERTVRGWLRRPRTGVQ
ncbi:MAG: hypothetical protein ACJ76V_13845 [Thermoleophilaceae bacterium]